MDLYLWLSICVVLLSISWALIFFRKQVIKRLALHPNFTKAVAIILALALLVLALLPFLVWLKFGLR